MSSWVSVALAAALLATPAPARAQEKLEWNMRRVTDGETAPLDD